MKPKLIAKIESEESSVKLAVLIDADNAQPSAFEYLLPEIAKFGEATVKRIYGDFTSPNSAQWRVVLNEYAIKPVQQFAYTKGKNATDSTLIIDAMDLLYTRRFDGFVLISSDSDFTGLATRIREEGLFVYGFGRKTTPDAFRNACHKFVFTEILIPQTEPKQPIQNEPKKVEIASEHISQPNLEQKDLSKNELPLDFIKQALDQSADENGWANIGTFGSFLTKLRSDFDSRQFGYKTLSKLIKSRVDIFEIEERIHPTSGDTIIHLRVKQ
ncbi:MAG: NYN domain-containing protein [Fibrobacteres bacterium]|nr:NYN domain-containing protein [Fibrobacterota bacterium]